MTTDDLQFRFKSKLGCDSSLSVWTSTVNYFIQTGSSVFAAPFDISKASDTVNHHKLLTFLADKSVPGWLLSLLENWYLKLVGRWLGCYSRPFHIANGVRQGSSLSPVLFNVYIDKFILELCHLNKGCHIGDNFLGCVLYADDIILLSASVHSL